MKFLRHKYRLVLASAVSIGLVGVWAAAHQRKNSPKDWLLVSTPIVGSQIDKGDARPMVTFRVANVGPRSVDFKVRWFECRAKRDRTLMATNQLKLMSIPLPPGKTTDLKLPISLATAPAEDGLCCCQIQWLESESAWRRCARMLDRPMMRLFDIFSLDWESPWQPPPLTNGSVFAANTEVADYFRQMYGCTRTQWVEELARQQSARSPTQASGVVVRGYGRDPTDDEMLEREAKRAFAEFCQSSTARDAEPNAASPAAPPHR